MAIRLMNIKGKAMKRILSVLASLNTIAALFFLPVGAASADVVNCPYGTTAGCVNWIVNNRRDRMWMLENNGFWQFFGDLKPYGEIGLRVRLLNTDNSVHVFNDKGQQNHFPTSLMYAYQERKCHYFEINGSCAQGIVDITSEIAFTTNAYGNTHRMNIVAKTYGNPNLSRGTMYCIHIDGIRSCRYVSL